jgi:hypothetical protein
MQLTLTDLSKPQAKLVFDCWTCGFKRDIVMINGQQKVKCRVRGLLDFQDGCNSWSDGKDLEHCHKAPEGFVPKKYGGRV